MRALVNGSRDWNDYKLVRIVLLGLLQSYDTLEIISGCARGADSLGEKFAEEFDLKCYHFPADWEGNGKAAGPIRNQKMLDEGKPNVVVAFKDGLHPKLEHGGTEDLLRRAKAAGIPIIHIDHG